MKSIHLPFTKTESTFTWRWTRNSDLRRRRNGWSWPPSALQLLCWLAIPVIAPSTAFLLLPLHQLYAPLAVLIATLYLLLQIIILTSIDPAVSNLHKGQGPALFDATKHNHVIENLYCNICLIHVDPTCKHCRQCNKCISGFDHHCKWLNNCVGAVNYRLFLLLVMSVCFISAIISTCLIVLPVISFINSKLLLDINKLPMEVIMWQALCLGACVPYTIVAFLCAHLIYFHYKLWEHGMTTYSFIRVNPQSQLQKNDEQNIATTTPNRVPDTVTVEKSCSKRSTISLFDNCALHQKKGEEAVGGLNMAVIGVVLAVAIVVFLWRYCGLSVTYPRLTVEQVDLLRMRSKQRLAAVCNQKNAAAPKDIGVDNNKGQTLLHQMDISYGVMSNKIDKNLVSTQSLLSVLSIDSLILSEKTGLNMQDQSCFTTAKEKRNSAQEYEAHTFRPFDPYLPHSDVSYSIHLTSVEENANFMLGIALKENSLEATSEETGITATDNTAEAPSGISSESIIQKCIKAPHQTLEEQWIQHELRTNNELIAIPTTTAKDNDLEQTSSSEYSSTELTTSETESYVLTVADKENDSAFENLETNLQTATAKAAQKSDSDQQLTVANEISNWSTTFNTIDYDLITTEAERSELN